MRIEQLRIERLRALDAVELTPSAGLNVLYGDNGAGKTSILEAIHLLAYGRSFRSGARDTLIQRGETELCVFAQLRHEHNDALLHLGLSRQQKVWNGRINGESVSALRSLFQALPAVCFEPGSHALISGASEHRRKLIDWALFHVEPGFWSPWRRYQRALKQRNALLKQQGAAIDFEVWEEELALHGACLHRLREHWLEGFTRELETLAARLLPTLGAPKLRYQPGWNQGGDIEVLRRALHASRGRDMLMGHTTQGPHRADWSLTFEQAPMREMLSRGQEKLVALCCLMAQAHSFARARNEWPILLLDDLPSELDGEHLTRTLEWLAQTPLQAFITGVSRVEWHGSPVRPVGVFHVEQGKLGRLL